MPHLRLPTLFLSHGSPMIAIEDSPTQRFLRRLGPVIDERFGRPRAVVVMSPHSMSRNPLVLGALRHATVHDFGGFPPALYEIEYPAAGDPDLAHDVARRLAESGFNVPAVDAGGLDHGIWTPLMHLWPRAEVPVVPVMLPALAPPAELTAMGEALAPLCDDGVLIVGSGSLTHNLGRVFGAGGMPAVDAPETADCAAFRAWVHETVAGHDHAGLLQWATLAPHARAMHPTDEHWRPFHFAVGAALPSTQAVRLHADVEFGCLAMDAYAFGDAAALLAQALAN